MSFELDLYDVMLGQLADIGIEILSDRPKESERNRESACAKIIKNGRNPGEGCAIALLVMATIALALLVYSQYW